jgi:hypothetical protein
MPLLTVTALSEAGAVASFDVAAIMQAAVTSVQGDLFKVLGIVVPAAVTIIGAGVAVRYGIRWLKSLRSA